MRRLGIIGGVGLAALVAATAAEAHCAEDVQELQSRIMRAQKTHWTAQGNAAALILQRYADSPSGDEVSCYNALARARSAFNGPPPAPQEAQEGQAVRPVQPLEQRP
jgi:hypothetical protein